MQNNSTDRLNQLFATGRVSAISSVTPLPDVEAPNFENPQYDLILLIGQSNTVGTATPIDPNFDYQSERVLTYDTSGAYQNRIRRASHPLGHHDVVPDAIGYGLQFAKFFTEYVTDKKVILLPCAKGGTSFLFNDWRPDSVLETFAINRINTLQQQGHKLKCILWHQGESDIGLGKTNYKAALTTLISRIRTQTNNPTVPFLIGTFSEQYYLGDFARLQIENAFRELVTEIPYTGLADATAVNTVLYDGVHFDTVSLRAMGDLAYPRAYYEAISNLPQIPPTVNNSDITITTGKYGALIDFKRTNIYLSKVNAMETTSKRVLTEISANNRILQIGLRNHSGVSTPNQIEATPSANAINPQGLQRFYNFANGGVDATGSGDNIGVQTSQGNRIISAEGRPTVMEMQSWAYSNLNDYTMSANFTKSIWVRFTSTALPTNVNNLFIFGDVSWSWSDVWCNLGISKDSSKPGYPDYLTFRCCAGTPDEEIYWTLSSIQTVVANLWYHIVITNDNTTQRLKMYINGTLENEHRNFQPYVGGGGSPVTLGSFTNSTVNEVLYYLDNARIFNRVLTELEVWDLHREEILVTNL